jgi:hypothetical protein
MHGIPRQPRRTGVDLDARDAGATDVVALEHGSAVGDQDADAAARDGVVAERSCLPAMVFP